MTEVSTPARTKPFWANRLSPQLNTLWRGRWRPGTVEPARYLYDHELVLVTEGACTVQIEKTGHELRAGDYVIIPPDTYHTTSTASGVYRNCIHFDWERTRIDRSRVIWCFYPKRPPRSALGRCPSFVPKKYFFGSFRQIAPISALVETLFHRWQTGDQVTQALSRGTFLEVIILLMSRADQKTRAPRHPLEYAYAVRDLLDEQIDSKEGIQQLLITLGFSYPHLCRQFRGAFGITPVEYRNAQRLERAKTHLANPRLTVAEVAFKVGFTDAGYFSRQFRRQNSLSPKEWREHPIFP